MDKINEVISSIQETINTHTQGAPEGSDRATRAGLAVGGAVASVINSGISATKGPRKSCRAFVTSVIVGFMAKRLEQKLAPKA